MKNLFLIISLQLWGVSSLYAGDNGGFFANKINFLGKNDSRVIYNNEDKIGQWYFNDWADISIDYNNRFRINLGYEAHLPPPPLSFSDSVEQRIVNRSLEFLKDNFSITAGTFQVLLGKGITLKSFVDRDLNWNTDMDGVITTFTSDIVEAKFLGARPRNNRGIRQKPLLGTELKIYTYNSWYNGVTLIATEENISSEKTGWGSLYSGFTLPFMDFYIEYAARNFYKKNSNFEMLFRNYDQAFPEGKAVYSLINVNRYPVTVLLEGKHYSSFYIDEGIYNNPPRASHEHLFSFFNKKQFVQNANDEMGYLAEVTYSLNENNIILLSYGDTRDLKGQPRYNDIYLQCDLELPAQINSTAGIGRMEDPSERNWTVAVVADIPLNSNWSAEGEFQHQHTTKFSSAKTDRLFYSQEYFLSAANSSGWRTGVLVHSTTDQETSSDISIGKYKLFVGLQLNATLMKSHELALFVGTRQKGKSCAGGVCMEKPALRGIEFTLDSKF